MLKPEEWPLRVRTKLTERENKHLEKLVNGFQNIRELPNEIHKNNEKINAKQKGGTLHVIDHCI